VLLRGVPVTTKSIALGVWFMALPPSKKNESRGMLSVRYVLVLRQGAFQKPCDHFAGIKEFLRQSTR
jgi:hypothetical protein